MRLFVNCRDAQHRIYIASTVEHRRDLPFSLEVQCPLGHGTHDYSRDEVNAEAGKGGAAAGGILGGLIGLLGGPIGLILGGIGGAVLGAGGDAQEQERVKHFED